MTMGRDELLKAAARVAADWNHHWLGTEHVLVAYLEAERANEVKPFLTDAGLRFDAAETNVKEAVPPRDEREEGNSGLIHTPRIARICGFAQGWAAASAWPDPPTVTAEHVMLAMLWMGTALVPKQYARKVLTSPPATSCRVTAPTPTCATAPKRAPDRQPIIHRNRRRRE